MSEPTTQSITWLSTKEAAARLGVTLRSLYRFIDEGGLTAYKFGRVIRLQQADVDRFIDSSRIIPGSLEHLYPDTKPAGGTTTFDGPRTSDAKATDRAAG